MALWRVGPQGFLPVWYWLYCFEQVSTQPPHPLQSCLMEALGRDTEWWAVAGHLNRHPNLTCSSPETCLNQWLKHFFPTNFCLIPRCVLVSRMTLNLLWILRFIVDIILLQKKKKVNRKCLENEALLSGCVWWPPDECPLCHRRCWLTHYLNSVFWFHKTIHGCFWSYAGKPSTLDSPELLCFVPKQLAYTCLWGGSSVLLGTLEQREMQGKTCGFLFFA